MLIHERHLGANLLFTGFCANRTRYQASRAKCKPFSRPNWPKTIPLSAAHTHVDDVVNSVEHPPARLGSNLTTEEQMFDVDWVSIKSSAVTI